MSGPLCRPSRFKGMWAFRIMNYVYSDNFNLKSQDFTDSYLAHHTGIWNLAGLRSFSEALLFKKIGSNLSLPFTFFRIGKQIRGFIGFILVTLLINPLSLIVSLLTNHWCLATASKFPVLTVIISMLGIALASIFPFTYIPLLVLHFEILRVRLL